MTHERTSQELVGNAIVGMDDGQKIASVQEILMKPDTFELAAVVVDKGGMFRPDPKFIRAEDVQVWGKDALLVSHSDIILKKSEYPDYEKWVPLAERLRGRPVVDTHGNKIGRIDDVMISTQGKVTGFRLSEVTSRGVVGDEGRLAVELVEALGQDVVIANLEGMSAKPEGKETVTSTERPVEAEEESHLTPRGAHVFTSPNAEAHAAAMDDEAVVDAEYEEVDR